MSSSRSPNSKGLLRSRSVSQDPGASTIGKYELLRRLAVGGMGEVFLARQRGLAGFDRIVVVKRLLPEMAEKAELVSLFIDEAKIAANLSHPNIVGVFDFGFADDAYFLSMEYVAGQNLARIAGRLDDTETQLPISSAVFIVAEVLRGLEFAHRAADADGRPLGIVHRDVSPHNVMVSYGGDVKLMDFGIAKAANKSHRTEAGVIRGKLSYMSPEQARGDELDARSDVFSVGILLWELTLGCRLFDGDGLVDTIAMVTKKPIPKPTDIDPDYPVELEWIVMSALSRDLSERATSAAELESALRTFLVHSGAHIDRERIGADVAELFPKEAGNLSDDELSAGTSSESITRAMDGTASVPEVALADTSPEPEQVKDARNETHEASSDVKRSVEPVRARHPEGKGGGWILPAVLIAAVAGAAIVFAVTRDTSSKETRPAVAQAIDAGAAGSTAEAEVDAAVDNPRPGAGDAGTKLATTTMDAQVRPRPRPRTRIRRPTVRRRTIDAGARGPVKEVAVDARRPTLQPTPKALKGKLVVDAVKGWGTVYVDNRMARRTPFFADRATGSYSVKVVMSGGGGTFQTRAVIAPNKRTKCIVDSGRLTCAAPR